MYGKTRKIRIRNECIRKHLEGASIGDKLRDCFEHVQCMLAMTLERKIFVMQDDNSSRKRGWLKRTWMKIVRIDMKWT